MGSEFQAVILAGGSGSGLYPLTINKPKSLLPVGPRPLLYYQLHILEEFGFEEAIVVCHQHDYEEFNRHVTQLYPGKLQVDLHPIDEEKVGGTLDVLKELKDKLVMDFFVLTGDVVTIASLHDLADVHRLRMASMTMLLKEHKDAHLKKERKDLYSMNKHVVNFFGIVTNDKTFGPKMASESSKGKHARVVFMKSATEGDDVEIPKSLLWSEPNMKLHTNLIDPHVYIFRRWVLDLISNERDDIVGEKMKEMSSLRTDFLPFLINKLQPKCREENILNSGKDNTDDDVNFATLGHSDPPFTQARQMSSHTKNSLSTNRDGIRVFALVCPSHTYTCRANTLYSYASVNHAVANLPKSLHLPWPKTISKTKFKETYVGESTEIAADTVSIKNSIIGSHVTIGQGAMISNSIIMNHCNIMPEVVIQNSIISENCTVSEKCNLNEVQLESECRVQPPGSRLKGQAYTRSDFA